MDKKRSSSGLAAVATFLLIAASLGLYVAGYFALGKKSAIQTGPSSVVVMRGFRQAWLPRAYVPMAAIEQTIAGVDVQLCAPGGDYGYIFLDP
jgi:hypothetical protein